MTDTTDKTTAATLDRGVDRRSLLKAGAWAAPVLVATAAAPRAAAATGGSGVTVGAATLVRNGGGGQSRNLRSVFSVSNTPGQPATVNVEATVEHLVNGSWVTVPWTAGSLSILPGTTGVGVPADGSTEFTVTGAVAGGTTSPFRLKIDVTVTAPYSTIIPTYSAELII